MTYFLNLTQYLCLKVSRNTGFLVTLIFTLTMLSLESVAVRNTMYYDRNIAHDNIYIADNQIAVFETRTEFLCLMSCNHNEFCQSFSYNSLSMGCQHFLLPFWDKPVTGTNESGWLHYDPYKALDCKNWNERQCVTGIYPIFPPDFHSFKVKCEMDVDGGGWTVIQQRFDGSVNFQKTWKEYKAGFGDLHGEFWLGNEQIHDITTSADYELRIDISDWHGRSWYAIYKTFKVGDEIAKYKLTIGIYSGTAGDSMSVHNGKRFSTKDRDNDAHGGFHCSRDWGGSGGWWYAACDQADLNGGVYGEDIGEDKSTEWESALGKGAPTLKTTRMMIRRL